MSARKTPRNPLVAENGGMTAENVACVLRYLSELNSPDGFSFSESSEMGRCLILQTCAEALDTVGRN